MPDKIVSIVTDLNVIEESICKETNEVNGDKLL